MKRRWISLFLCAVLLLAILPAGVSAAGARVALITDGGELEDQSFNQAVNEAAAAWCKANGVLYQVYEPADFNTESIVAKMERAISDGATMLLLPGYTFALEETVALAEKHPGVTFLCLDCARGDFYFVDELPTNLICITYREEQAGFMAGYAAVKLGYRHLGFLGGLEVAPVDRYGYGFVQGADAAAKELDVDVSVLYGYAGQFYGNAEVTAAVTGWYQTGVEVIFACGGGVYASVAEAAQYTGCKVIGVEVDQAPVIDGLTGEKVTVTSAMKNLGATTKAMLSECVTYHKTTAYGGREWRLGLASATDLETNYVCLPDSTQWNSGFTREDYAALVAKLLNWTYAPTDSTEAAPATSIPVSYVNQSGCSFAEGNWVIDEQRTGDESGWNMSELFGSSYATHGSAMEIGKVDARGWASFSFSIGAYTDGTGIFYGQNYLNGASGMFYSARNGSNIYESTLRTGSNDLLIMDWNGIDIYWKRAPGRFQDVAQNAWYYDAVEYVVENGLMNGVGHGKFEPEDTMTRAMLVTVLWRMAGSPTGAVNTFTDVPDSQWFAQAVAWASENGIVNGVGHGKFEPEESVTREQIAVIFYRYCDKMGINAPATPADLSVFPDGGTVSDWAKEAMAWANGIGLIKGSQEGSSVYLLPQGEAERAQVATMLMRFIEEIM